MTPLSSCHTCSLNVQFVRVRGPVARLFKGENFPLCVVPLAGGLHFGLPHWIYLFPCSTREAATYLL